MRCVLCFLLVGMVVGVSAPAAAQDITSNLLGHWKLIETSGSTADDSSTNNDGTYQNGVSLASSTPVTGIGAVAATFDGVNDYVSIPNESAFDITGNITVAAWIKVNAFDKSFQVIIAKGNVSWRIAREGATNFLTFSCNGVSPNKVVSTINVNNGLWHHVAGVYNGSSLRIYIDGVLNQSVTASGLIATNNVAVNIGQNTEIAGREWDGSIFDVRVYNRALSAADIATLYNLPSLIAHWKLDELSGTTASDSSGFVHTGTVTGTATWTTGIIDNGFQFNGSTRIQATGLLGNPRNVSVAAWANLTAADTNGAEVISLGDHVSLRVDEDGSNTNASFYNGSAWVVVPLAKTFAGTGWHHFAATFDDTANSFKLYVDGVQAASMTTTSSISYAGLGSNTVLGRHGNSNTAMDFTGTLDDVRVYNYTLTAAEVAQLYGLFGHWKLNQTSGTVATDSSGMANNGTYTNGVTLNGSGPYPGAGAIAASFDGVNDYVSIPNESFYDITTSVTVAAWIRVDVIDTAYQAIVTKGDSAWQISRSNSGNTLRFACSGLTTVEVNGAIDVNDGQWHHVAGVYTGSLLRLYVDGQLDASVSATGSIATNNNNVEIGRNAGATGREFDGSIYDVRVYSRALNQAQIADLYGLVGWWKLNETSGTAAADFSGVSRNGTYANGVTLGGAGPTAGTYAASFDGTNDYVNIPSEWRNYVNGFSFAVWARPAATGSYARFADFGAGQDQGNLTLTRQATTTTLEAGIYDGTLAGKRYIEESGAIALGAWRHYVVTVDSTGQAKLYVGGVEVATSVSSIGLPTNLVRSNNYIARSNWAADAYYTGGMYDMRHYNRPISIAEVLKLYGGGVGSVGVRIIKWVEIQ